jgi:hypothetical protein
VSAHAGVTIDSLNKPSSSLIAVKRVKILLPWSKSCAMRETAVTTHSHLIGIWLERVAMIVIGWRMSFSGPVMGWAARCGFVLDAYAPTIVRRIARQRRRRRVVDG